MLHADRTGLKSWIASGELWIWMNAAAVGISIAAVGGLLGLIAVRGLAHFWPADIAAVHYQADSGEIAVVLGELVESETMKLEQYREATGDEQAFPASTQSVERWLVKTGNRRLDPPDFQWLYGHRITDISYPEEAAVFERMEWGNAYGTLLRVLENGQPVTAGEGVWTAFRERLARVTALRDEIAELERGELNRVNHELDRLRLERRRLDLDPEVSPAARGHMLAVLDAKEQSLNDR